ncbi:1393_t:CDS:1, partial [Cetraspora pellucida]
MWLSNDMGGDKYEKKRHLNGIISARGGQEYQYGHYYGEDIFLWKRKF